MNKKRIVLISGGTRGLGEALVTHFSLQGDVVNFIYLKNKEQAQKICKAHKGVSAYQGDVADSIRMAAIVKDIVSRYQRIDVLINNAGMVKESLLVKLKEVDWDEVVGCNLKGVFFLTQNVTKCMVRQKDGHIINISSIVGLEGREALSAYSSAKAAVISFTKSIARELGEHNIKANVVIPGFLKTDMTAAASKTALFDKVKNKNVLGRIGTIAEVAAFIYHLSLMENVSGQFFNLDSRILKGI